VALEDFQVLARGHARRDPPGRGLFDCQGKVAQRFRQMAGVRVGDIRVAASQQPHAFVPAEDVDLQRVRLQRPVGVPRGHEDLSAAAGWHHALDRFQILRVVEYQQPIIVRMASS